MYEDLSTRTGALVADDMESRSGACSEEVTVDCPKMLIEIIFVDDAVRRKCFVLSGCLDVLYCGVRSSIPKENCLCNSVGGVCINRYHTFSNSLDA